MISFMVYSRSGSLRSLILETFVAFRDGQNRRDILPLSAMACKKAFPRPPGTV